MAEQTFFETLTKQEFECFEAEDGRFKGLWLRSKVFSRRKWARGFKGNWVLDFDSIAECEDGKLEVAIFFVSSR